MLNVVGQFFGVVPSSFGRTSANKDFRVASSNPESAT